MLLLTKEEVSQIVNKINPIFNQVLNEYDYGKYPPQDYQRFKDSFSGLKNPNNDIYDAMIWKWGHWGKNNFPTHHRALINQIQQLWPQFITSNKTKTPKDTFDWWRTNLNRQTTYITAAYITHLIHHDEPLPIIDQHNFRAMNSLLSIVRPPMKATKKKPSNWNDIASLNEFMTAILAELGNRRSFGELDRFLMMYGRNHVARKH